MIKNREMSLSKQENYGELRHITSFEEIEEKIKANQRNISAIKKGIDGAIDQIAEMHQKDLKLWQGDNAKLLSHNEQMAVELREAKEKLSEYEKRDKKQQEIISDFEDEQKKWHDDYMEMQLMLIRLQANERKRKIEIKGLNKDIEDLKEKCQKSAYEKGHMEIDLRSKLDEVKKELCDLEEKIAVYEEVLKEGAEYDAKRLTTIKRFHLHE